MSKPCPNVYERIYTGGLPGRIAYKNPEHGLMVVLDRSEVAPAHLVAATLACAESVDAIPHRSLHNKLSIVAQYAGLVLGVAYPETPYIGTLVAGNQIPHPHVHRVLGDGDADWAKRFGKAHPRLDLPDAAKDLVLERVTHSETGQVEDLWAQCSAELDAEGPVDPLTLAMMEQFSIPIET
jgi:hypothetical protein